MAANNHGIQLYYFENKLIRRQFESSQWLFSVVDIIGVLTEDTNPNQTWKRIKEREPDIITICYSVKMQRKDGKFYPADAVSFEGALRLIQSIPSQKAEPLKRELAKLAKQKIEEIVNPDLAVERAMENYQRRGRNERWIQQRIMGIGTRKKWTDELKDRGLSQGWMYGVLTNNIHSETFGMKKDEHALFKNLPKNKNLRDNCSEEELALLNLAETTATSLHIKRNSHGFNKLQVDAKDGGHVAGKAREHMERLLGRSVLSETYFLPEAL